MTSCWLSSATATNFDRLKTKDLSLHTGNMDSLSDKKSRNSSSEGILPTSLIYWLIIILVIMLVAKALLPYLKHNKRPKKRTVSYIPLSTNSISPPGRKVGFIDHSSTSSPGHYYRKTPGRPRGILMKFPPGSSAHEDKDKDSDGENDFNAANDYTSHLTPDNSALGNPAAGFFKPSQYSSRSRHMLVGPTRRNSNNSPSPRAQPRHSPAREFPGLVRAVEQARRYGGSTNALHLFSF